MVVPTGGVYVAVAELPQPLEDITVTAYVPAELTVAVAVVCTGFVVQL